jgi:enoyl-[acyl-carrier protein] reductase I
LKDLAHEQDHESRCRSSVRQAAPEREGAALCRAARPRELEASITGEVDVSVPGQLEALFEQIRRRWGRLDILVHSIAFAPKADLQGGLLNCSAEGFAKAMDVSCHSFVRMAKLAAPLMTNGGAMFAMSYISANRVVAN